MCKVVLCSAVIACAAAGAGAAEPAPSWLDAGWQLVAEQRAREAGPATQPASPRPATQPAGEGQPFVHWTKRVGPAYPDDGLRSFGRWAKELPATLWDDTKATVQNRWSLVGFALAAATGVLLRETDADDRVEDHFRRHGHNLNRFWDVVGDAGGNPGSHFAVAGAMYFGALWAGDVKTYEKSKTLINALAMNGLVTLALKGIVNTETPNGNDFGWPSGHTSSTFCFATVLWHEYGPWVGVPAMLFAGYVGYERVDAANHDFSDVISGALIGIAIGHAVSRNHQARVLGMDVVPWTDPRSGAVGVALTKRW